MNPGHVLGMEASERLVAGVLFIEAEMRPVDCLVLGGTCRRSFNGGRKSCDGDNKCNQTGRKAQNVVVQTKTPSGEEAAYAPPVSDLTTKEEGRFIPRDVRITTN